MVLEVLLTAASALLLVPVGVVLCQVLAALLPAKREEVPAGPRPAVAVLVPAHNESASIARTIEGIRRQLEEDDRLVVVADNCSDETAAIARTAGAEVIERRDPARRGKGYALDFGVRHLAADPREIVLIVDADCELSAGAVDHLARVSRHSGNPVQALYLMRSPEGAGPLARIGEFAWIVRNQVRPLGWHRLGLPCHLMGTGMAFPMHVLQGATLATGDLVEDLGLSVELARREAWPQLCPEALVTSVFPETRQGLQRQRLRWEHGQLATSLKWSIALLAEGIKRGSRPLVAFALDLGVPPLALVFLAVSALLALNMLFFSVTDAALPLALAGITFALLTFTVLLSWAGFARHVLPLRALALAPLYALWKAPIYAAFWLRRQADWVRSERRND